MILTNQAQDMGEKEEGKLSQVPKQMNTTILANTFSACLKPLIESDFHPLTDCFMVIVKLLVVKVCLVTDDSTVLIMISFVPSCMCEL